MPLNDTDGDVHCRHCGMWLGVGNPKARVFEDLYCAHLRIPSVREGRDQICEFLYTQDPVRFNPGRLAASYGMSRPAMAEMLGKRGLM